MTSRARKWCAALSTASLLGCGGGAAVTPPAERAPAVASDAGSAAEAAPGQPAPAVPSDAGAAEATLAQPAPAVPSDAGSADAGGAAPDASSACGNGEALPKPRRPQLLAAGIWPGLAHLSRDLEPDDAQDDSSLGPAIGVAVGPIYPVGGAVMLWPGLELSMLGAGDWINVAATPRFLVEIPRSNWDFTALVTFGAAYAARDGTTPSSFGWIAGGGLGVLYRFELDQPDWDVRNQRRLQELESTYSAECLDADPPISCKRIAEEMRIRLAPNAPRPPACGSPPNLDPNAPKAEELVRLRLYTECREFAYYGPVSARVGPEIRFIRAEAENGAITQSVNALVFALTAQY